MKRRDFIRTSGIAAGALALNGLFSHKVAMALEAEDQYLVFGYFEGGWDILLGLDPRDPSVFTSNAAPETGIEPAYSLIGGQFPHQPVSAGAMTLGPCVGELAEIPELFSVIRGINMATLTHEVGRRYFITGRPPSGLKARGSSAASLAAAQLGNDRPIPNISLRVETFAEGLPSYAGALQISSVQHIQYILRENLGIPTYIPQAVREALNAHEALGLDCAPGSGAAGSELARTYLDNRVRARALVKNQFDQHFVFDHPAMAEVRQAYAIDQYGTESPLGRAALASQAIKSGLSRVVSVVLSDQLDTHDGTWANDHPPRLAAGFMALSRLLRDLRDTEHPSGGSYLDRTTILAFSEFARTPRLNARKGRDHHLTNCAFLAGRGIEGGRIAGASSDLGMGPEHIDLVTGEPTDSGISLKPEHVISTLLAAQGLDASVFNADPIEALLK